jgi:hypothetical protein
MTKSKKKKKKKKENDRSIKTFATTTSFVTGIKPAPQKN